MAAANAINSFAATPSPGSSSNASASSKSSGSDQSFSASLADARQIVHMQHAQDSNAQNSNKQSDAGSDDAKAAGNSSPINDASKDAGGATDTAQTVAPWLALLQAQLAQQAAPLTTPTDASASAQQISDVLDASKANAASTASNSKTLSALLAAQKEGSGKADAKDKASDLLKALQADGGKQAATTADLAADGKDLPLTLGAGDKKNSDAADTDGQADASALAALTSGTRTSTHATETQATPTTRTVAEPVGSDKWGAAVAQQVSIMVGKQEQHMEMQLNPPNLGPMEVKLSMAQDQPA